MRPPAFHQLTGLLRLGFTTDNVDIDLSARADETVDGRTAQKFNPTRVNGLPAMIL